MTVHTRSAATVCTLLGAIAVLVGLRTIPATAAGELIVYETYGYYGGPADIHVVNPDGTGDVNLTPGTEDSMELDPELSADGSSIVFISNRVTEQNPDGNFEIFTMATDGTAVTQVTVTQDPFGQGSIQSYNPTWSPDGTQIAFDGYRGSYQASEIYAINADGTGERRVTSDADSANKWRPDWSPDGSKILFTWGWDYYSQDVRTINPDGTGETNLTPDSIDSAEGSAVWSPDGTRIAFSADGTLPGVYPNPNREIFVMEYPSLVITQVTEHSAVDEDPAWSADGSEIIFASPRDGAYALYVIAAPPVPASSSVTSGTTATANTSSMAETPVRKLDPTSGDEADPFWGTTGGTIPPTNHTLIVSKAGSGKGNVKSNPAGISCGKDCSESYAAGTSVTLTAKAALNSAFIEWTGACSGTVSTCTLSMDAAKSVTATFNLTDSTGETYTLTVSKKGRGKVTSSPAGITCGKDCTEAYAAGTAVTLSATPRLGYKLSAWSGACTGAATTCTVTMNADKFVTATFVQE